MYGGGAEIKYDAADEDEVIINLIQIERVFCTDKWKLPKRNMFDVFMIKK